MGLTGLRFYGRLSNEANSPYIATLFFHIFFLPLIPVGTYFVLETAKHGPQVGRRRVGRRQAWSPRSVFFGYLSAWSTAGAIACSIVAGSRLVEAIGMEPGLLDVALTELFGGLPAATYLLLASGILAAGPDFRMELGISISVWILGVAGYLVIVSGYVWEFADVELFRRGLLLLLIANGFHHLSRIPKYLSMIGPRAGVGDVSFRE